MDWTDHYKALMEDIQKPDVRPQCDHCGGGQIKNGSCQSCGAPNATRSSDR